MNTERSNTSMSKRNTIDQRKARRTMKTVTRILLAVLAIFMASCSTKPKPDVNNELVLTGSGNVVSQSRPLSNFDQVEIGLSFDVTIRQGEDYQVTLFSDDNFIDFVQAEVQEGALGFGYIPGYAYDIKGVTLYAEVTMPELRGLSLTGSSHVMLDSVQSSETLDVELSGSSMLDGGLMAENANFVVNGSSLVSLSGSTEFLGIDACGNTLVDLRAFRASSANIQASCNSRVWLDVMNLLDGEASQYAQITYQRPPASNMLRTNGAANLSQK
jgi:hypothetical protein